MPTLDDLNAVFADLESAAPTPDTIPLSPVRAAGPRGARTAMLLAATVVAGAVTAVVVAGTSDSAKPAPAAAGPAPATQAPTQAASPTPSLPVPETPMTTTTGIPFRITGITDLVVTQATSAGGNGGVIITTSGTSWDFGWSPITMEASDKPATSVVNFDGRDWVVQRDRATGTITSLWVTAPGFTMTITPVGKDLTLEQYQEFLTHVSFPQDFSNPNSWPTLGDLG